ncbi:2609_t:CDS:2, partial [Scutellospora calospora]
KDLFNENIDIVVAKSVEGNDFNSGILLIRHSSWSFNFINNWQAVRTKRMVEQGSMWHLLDQFPDFKQRILILNHDDYPLSASLQTWKKDDFTLNYVSENCPAKFIKNSLKEIERN